MVVSAELVWRSGDRKGELVEFARGRRFGGAFWAAFARRLVRRRRWMRSGSSTSSTSLCCSSACPTAAGWLSILWPSIHSCPRRSGRCCWAGGRWWRGSSGSGDATAMRWWRSTWWTSWPTGCVPTGGARPLLRCGVDVPDRPAGPDRPGVAAERGLHGVARGQPGRGVPVGGGAGCNASGAGVSQPGAVGAGRERQREERGHFIAFFGSDLVRQAIDGWQYWVAHYEL